MIIYHIIFHTYIRMAKGMSGQCAEEKNLGWTLIWVIGVEKNRTKPHLVSNVTKFGSTCHLFHLATPQLHEQSFLSNTNCMKHLPICGIHNLCLIHISLISNLKKMLTGLQYGSSISTARMSEGAVGVAVKPGQSLIMQPAPCCESGLPRSLCVPWNRENLSAEQTCDSRVTLSVKCLQ